MLNHLYGYESGIETTNPITDVLAIQWTRWEDAVNIYGRGPDGFARSTFDNVGVQYGLQSLVEGKIDPEEFLRVPITVLVGDQDGTNGSLRHSKRLDSQQGVTRVERARNWVSAMIEAAHAYHMDSQVSFEVAEGTNHSFKQFMNRGALGKKVFEALFGQLVFSVAGEGAKGEAQKRG